MAEVTTIMTRDADTIETVDVFRKRKGLKTYAEALEKLIQRAKDAGLHLHDEPTIRAHLPIVGTVS